MQPTKSYRIWFTQRNGSTLLCKGLEQTGIAGKPGEFFNLIDEESLCEKYNATIYQDLKEKIWHLGASQNGVFGIKHSRHATRYEKIIHEIKILKGYNTDEQIDEQELLSDLFPTCKHIFLTRRNKVRQAASWWKAIKDQVWHLEPNQKKSSSQDFYAKHYDFAALSTLLKEACLRECSIQEHFSRYQINPLLSSMKIW
jgi:LPS sulfotransferase NodH